MDLTQISLVGALKMTISMKGKLLFTKLFVHCCMTCYLCMHGKSHKRVYAPFPTQSVVQMSSYLGPLVTWTCVKGDCQSLYHSSSNHPYLLFSEALHFHNDMQVMIPKRLLFCFQSYTNEMSCFLVSTNLLKSSQSYCNKATAIL